MRTGAKAFGRGRAQRWTATDALLRTSVLAILALAIALLVRRPDVLVLGVPFIIITVWSLARKPGQSPTVTATLAHEELCEGEATRLLLRADVPEHAELLGMSIERGKLVQILPTERAAERDLTGSADLVEIDFDARAQRWGNAEIGPIVARQTSAWGAYSCGPLEIPTLNLWTLPAATPYQGRAPAPHPHGLVGAHSSRQRGAGIEFADIRGFAPGDRLRHIHWPVSLRTGELHVRVGHAEQDAEIQLVLDAFHDIGPSTGVDGEASTLDLTLRAASSVAQHFTGTGDRVGLQVIGTEAMERLPAANGSMQLRRILDTLARIDAGSDPTPEQRDVHLRVGPESLVLMFSPVVSSVFLGWAVSLTRAGHTVVVVDTMGSASPSTDGVLGLAWRLRLLERERQLLRVQQLGVTVVPWVGSGSLDQVLRQVRRRGRTRRRA